MQSKNLIHSPRGDRSPVLKKTSSLSTLMQVIKLPDLSKATSPQLGMKFFINSQSPLLNLKLDRKPTQSLTAFSFSKAAEEISSIKKYMEQQANKEDTGNAKKSPVQVQEKKTPVQVPEITTEFQLANDNKKSLLSSELQLQGLSPKHSEHHVSIIPLNSIEEEPQRRLSIDIHRKKASAEALYKDEASPQKKKSNQESLPKDDFSPQKKKSSQDYLPKSEISLSGKSLTDETRSIVTTLNETKEELHTNKELLETEQKKRVDLENQIVSLSTKISEDENLIKTYEERFREANKVLKTNMALKGQVEEVKNKMQAELSKSGKEIAYITEELNLKAIELEECRALHTKAESQRKRYAETIREYESEISAIKNEKNALSIQVQEANAANSRMMEKLIMESHKVTQMDAKCKEADLKQCLIKSLNERISELERENAELREKLNIDLVKYSGKRAKWKELKAKQAEVIFDLNSQISKEKYALSSKIAEAFKNKRSSTIRDSQSAANITQDTIFKMQGKISELELNISSLKTDRENTNKNIEYYKGLLENKSHLISMLEEKIRKNEICLDKSMKEEIFEIKKIFENLEHSFEDNINDLHCQKCKIGKSVEYLIVPCEHLLCKTCMTYEDNCPICNNLARIHEFSILRIIMERSMLQYTVLKSIINSQFFNQ